MFFNSARQHIGFAHRSIKQFLRAAAVFLALLLVIPGAAVAQDMPVGIAPLRADPDPNGVNLFTGKVTTELPTLSLPAAPRLKFSRVQDVALLSKGSEVNSGGEMFPSNFTVDTIDGFSESFECQDRTRLCENVKGTGSVIKNNGYGYRQAGTGIDYDFNLWSTTTQQNGITSKVWHISKITYPDGEILTFTWDLLRPTRVSSNLGYHIDITYHGSVYGTEDWNRVARAAIFKSSDPTVPLRSFDYSWDGSPTTTIVETAGSMTRQYIVTGFSGIGATRLEASSGSVRRPTEASNSIIYTKHPSYNLVSSVVRDGVSWTYTYTNPVFYAGYAEYRYDRIVAAGPNGYHVTYDLGSSNEVNSRTDELNNVIGYQYDSYKRLSSITYPEGNSVSLDYDEAGNIITKTQTPKPGSTGNIVERAFVDLTPYVNPFGNLRCGDTALCWRPKWTKDGLGRQTDYVYNAQGQLTEQTEPADDDGVRRKTYIEYENHDTGAGIVSRKKAVRVCGWHPTNSALTSCGTNAEFRTEYDYFEHTFLPATERQVDLATGQIRETSYTYDPSGRLLSVDGPRPGTDDTQYFRYDAFGRKSWEIGALAPNGLRNAERTTYRNSDDKPILVEAGTIPNETSNTLTVNEQTDFTFDGRRNAIRKATSSGSTKYSVIDRSFLDRGMAECEAVRMNLAALPAASATAACALGTSGTDGQDRITKNSYDVAGRLTKVQQAYGTTSVRDQVTYAYTPNGKREFITDANGNKAQFKYDGYDRQSHWYLPSKTTVGTVSTSDYEQYGYDAVGNRTTLRKRDGRTLTFNYDGRNQITSKLVPDACVTGYVCTAPPSGSTRDVYYTYDMMGRQLTAKFDSSAGTDGLTSVYDPFGNLTSSTIAMSGFSKTLASLYDEAGDRTRLTHPDGQAFTYDYDALQRLHGVYEGVGTTVPLATFAFNTRGFLQSRTERPGSGASYTYDDVGRLKTQSDSFVGGVNNIDWGIDYNPASQITSETRSNDNYAQTGNAANVVDYQVNGLNQYDSNTSNSGTTTYGYDSNGNLTSYGTTSFVYDAENRLVKVTKASVSTYLSYDPLGRLWQVSGIGVTRFLYEGDALVAEYSSDGSLVARYVHGGNAAADDPIVWYPSASMAGERWLHANYQGSIVAVTDAAGTAPSINMYDEYGIPQLGVSGNNLNIGRFQYTGQAWLGELGMYYYKARIYSPRLGRFLQTDPVGYDDQSNLYAYVANDPLTKTDPTGTQGVVDDVIGWGQMVVDDLGDLAGGVAQGDFEWAFGGMPPQLGGGVVSESMAVGTAATALRAELATTKAAAAELRSATSVTSRTTRAGERAIKVESQGGRVKDISPTRVKEATPNFHPKAPKGTMQKTKFENAQPGSKDYKRDPTLTEQRMLRMPERPGVFCRYTGLFCR